MSSHIIATQNMFEVKTTNTIKTATLQHLTQLILSRVNVSWLDMVLSDAHTVNILLETTDNVDTVSNTIADIIDRHSQ